MRSVAEGPNPSHSGQVGGGVTREPLVQQEPLEAHGPQESQGLWRPRFEIEVPHGSLHPSDGQKGPAWVSCWVGLADQMACLLLSEAGPQKGE